MGGKSFYIERVKFMNRIHSSTPQVISEEITKLCAGLVENPQPLFLDVTPIEGAQVNDCFLVVENQIQQHGGSICYGWQIWEWPLVFVEAEFHAVWRDNSGILHDITPKIPATNRILFLPDPVRIYQDRQIDNVRRPLTLTADIKEFISASEAIYEFMNRGERTNQHGEITLTDTEVEEYERLTKRHETAYQNIVRWLNRKPRRNEPCPCGSGKKYKKFHGK
jgi:hypothetical protein